MKKSYPNCLRNKVFKQIEKKQREQAYQDKLFLLKMQLRKLIIQ